MKHIATYAALMGFLCFGANAWAMNNVWHGRAEGKLFTVTYSPNKKNVSITQNNKDFLEKLDGYAATDFYIKDLNNDNNDEIVFLDLAGASVGGELRLFYWDSGKLIEANAEYYANNVTLKHLTNYTYILLWQHDTDGLFYCDKILLFQKGELLETRNARIWDSVIDAYKKSLFIEKIRWRKSRLYAYIAIAYQKLGNKSKADRYMDKAKDLDSKNPFVR